MTSARFLLDEHVDRAVAAGLRRRGIEARTVHEVNRRGQTDEAHVEWARENGWVIVTGDDDYLKIASITEHSGVLFYDRDNYSIGHLIRGVEHIWTTESRESMRNERRFL